MYYEDLSPYTYSAVPTGLPKTWNIGWLSSRVPYRRGRLETGISQKLEQAVKTPVLLTRGRHECELCEGRATGNGEIWIADDTGNVYAAPSMISHYVEVHEYLPPSEFLEAARSRFLVLSETECEERISRHRRKLETSPEPVDILVPYFCVRIYWARELFGDLGDFAAFLALQHVSKFRTQILDASGFCVAGECHGPRELFREIVTELGPSGRAPFKCTFTLVHIGREPQTLLAEEL
jgi:hypothetical protein